MQSSSALKNYTGSHCPVASPKSTLNNCQHYYFEVLFWGVIKWSWTWKISITARTDWWTDELRCLRHHMSQPWTSGQNGTVSLPDSGINFVQVTSILMEFKFGGSDIHLGNSILVSMVYLQILNSASNLGMLLTVISWCDSNTMNPALQGNTKKWAG